MPDEAREAGPGEDARPESVGIAPTVPADEPTRPVDGAGRADDSVSTEVLRRLTDRPDTSGRYTPDGEVGHGGMGAVLRVFDEDLRRPLALKRTFGRVPRPGEEADAPTDEAPSGGTELLAPRTVARFLEEAQITGQLDHPGIVPVHELGIDHDGRAYFTMKLVKGETLKEVFGHLHSGDEGPSLTRVLTMLQRVCEAMAYAHERRVIHRDLKPANIMVGRFGEVYVMDWGLARVLDEDDSKDVRIRPEDLARTLTEVRSERHEAGSEDSPLVTMDGDIVGTPAYMPPEQARGEVDQLGPAADVYAVGAMLYHLLSGRMPYTVPGAYASPYAILSRAQEGPPLPLAEVAKDTPAELVSICEKAMAREPADRYPDMTALEADLRAYLENRVVAAHARGPFAELRKWVLRNKGLAAVLGLVFVLSAVAAVSFASINSDLTRLNDQLEVTNREFLVDRLLTNADRLWPAVPATVDEFDRWLGRAQASLARVDADPTGAHRGYRAMLADAGESSESHRRLTSLLAALGRLESVEERVRARREQAATLEQRSLTDPRVAALWQEAVRAAADPDGPYRGLALSPQLGLVPLGADPASGLQEFAHLLSGAAPVRGADGTLQLADESAVVLVLVPGGEVTPGALDGRAPAPVEVAPHFLAKHELTQSQWTRHTGDNPSTHPVGKTVLGDVITGLHPVETVSWDDARRTLGQLALRLPTEAEWEHAAQATDGTWWTGPDRENLRGAANLADTAFEAWAKSDERTQAWPGFEDGHACHAPVDALRPSPFGLHHLHGNVWELCSTPHWAGNGTYVAKGGGFLSSHLLSRAGFAWGTGTQISTENMGVRAARSLTP